MYSMYAPPSVNRTANDRIDTPPEKFMIGRTHGNPQLILLRGISVLATAGLQRRLNMVATQGETALYDAVQLGVEKVRQGRYRRHALLVISDGQDNASQYTLEQLRRRLKESDVQLYCVGVGRPGLSEKAEQRDEMRGQMILNEIARLTGGRAFFVNSASELEEATTRIALELRHQYSLGYAPTNQQHDGKWRKIQVRVNRSAWTPELIVRTRDGYYAATF
jgi:Ca-activated chloride channel family protein